MKKNFDRIIKRATALALAVIMTFGWSATAPASTNGYEPTITVGTSANRVRTRDEFIAQSRISTYYLHFGGRVYTRAEFFDAYHGLAFNQGNISRNNSAGVRAMNVTLRQGVVSAPVRIRVENVSVVVISAISESASAQDEVEPIIFEILTLFTNEELLGMIETAPSHTETRSAMTFTNRHITNAELAAWIEEYKSLGGLNAFELELIMLINEIRIGYGLNPWAISMELSMAARFHSQEMFDLEFMSHRSPIHGGPTERAIMFGHVNSTGSHGTFENIGGARNGRRTPQMQVDAWMNSPGHRAALLRDWHISIGVGRVGGHTTAKFGS